MGFTIGLLYSDLAIHYSKYDELKEGFKKFEEKIKKFILEGYNFRNYNRISKEDFDCLFNNSSYLEKEFAKYGWNVNETKEFITFKLDLNETQGDPGMSYDLDIMFFEFIAKYLDYGENMEIKGTYKHYIIFSGNESECYYFTFEGGKIAATNYGNIYCSPYYLIEGESLPKNRTKSFI